MKWVYPEFLFALGVLVIPLVIHLFHFRKYKTIYFSSIAFVKSVEQEQKNPRKLKHLLILLARMLAFACLVIAFAQPYFSNQTAVDSQESQLIGVYIDNSFSMSRIGERGELLSQAKELAVSLVEKAPRNTQYLVFTNELSGSEKQVLNQAKLVDVISKIQYSPLVRTKQEVVAFWNDWLADSQIEEKRIQGAEFIYISDFQQEKLPSKTTKFKHVHSLTPLQLSPQVTGNLFVDTIWFETPIQKLGAPQTIYARVVNSGSEKIESAVVQVKIGKMARDLFSDIPPFSSDTVQLNYFNQTPGIISGVVSINDKQMNQDDAFYFNYEVKKSSSVLLIQGEDAMDNVKVVYELDPFYRLSEVPVNQASSMNLDEFDLVVLNGLNQLPSQLNTSLLSYFEEKGSLLLIPGANISPSGWNSFLQRVHLPNLQGIQTTGLGIKKLNLQDPFFTGVFEGKPENITLPAVTKSYRAVSSSTTLATNLMTYQNGTPFFVKSSHTGSAYLFTTSFKQEFSTFITNQLFSTLLLHVGKLSQRQNPLYILIGSDGSYPLNDASQSEVPVHLTQASVDFIPNTFTKNKRPYISVQGIEAIRQLKAGNYSIIQDSKNQGTVSMNYNRLESHTTTVKSEEIIKEFANQGITLTQVQNGSDWNSASLLAIGNNNKLWRWFVLLAGVFVLCEMILQIFYKK